MSDYKALPPDQLKFAHYDTGHWPASSVDRAVYRYAAARPNHIFATAHLEGNTFTLPEVRSLLENEIPPGHREEEIQQIIDLDDASTRLIDRVSTGTFRLDLEESNAYNLLLSQHVVIVPGVPRYLSKVNQDGRGAVVALGNGDHYIGYTKDEMRQAIEWMLPRITSIDDPVERAINYAAFMSYAQVYMDGNKRTARYMMDGVLMSHGYDCVLIRASDKDAYNEALRGMFRSENLACYADFLYAVCDRAYRKNSDNGEDLDASD